MECRRHVFLITPLVLLAAPAARAQDASSASPATTVAPPAPAPSPPPPGPDAESGAQMRNGVAVETHVYTRFVSLGVGTNLTQKPKLHASTPRAERRSPKLRVAKPRTRRGWR